MRITTAFSRIALCAGLVAPLAASSQNLGVDIATPQQKLDVAGGLKIGNSTNGIGGSFRWTGTNMEWHDGVAWRNIGSVGGGGSGTTNFLPKWTSSTALGNSQLFDNGTNVGIGTNTPLQTLHLVGTARISTLTGATGGVVTANTSGDVSRVSFTGNVDDVLTGNGAFTDIATIVSDDWTMSGNLLFPNNLSADVGVGTNTPSQRLELEVSNAGFNLPLFIQNRNNTTGNVVGIGFTNENNFNFAKAAIIHERGAAGLGVGDMKFLVRSSADNAGVDINDTRMTITSGGTVGINSLSGAGSRVVVADASGNLTATALASSYDGDIQSVTAGDGLTGGGTSGAVTVTASANNGLTVNSGADAIQLGGALTASTTITAGNFDMTYNMSGTGDFRVQDNGTDVLFIKDDGNVGIGQTNPTYKLHVTGKVKTNGINETSDARLKTNVRAIESALDKVLRLEGVTYDWKTKEFPQMQFSEGRQYGLIAQQVESVIPELVQTDGEGWKSIEYSHLVPVLIEALKEMKGLVGTQQEQIDVLKAELQTLRTTTHQLSGFGSSNR
jgi:hypothetical protein